MSAQKIINRLSVLQAVLEYDSGLLDRIFTVWERMLINNERASLFETLNDLEVNRKRSTSRNYQVNELIEFKINQIIELWKQ